MGLFNSPHSRWDGSTKSIVSFTRFVFSTVTDNVKKYCCLSSPHIHSAVASTNGQNMADRLVIITVVFQNGPIIRKLL